MMKCFLVLIALFSYAAIAYDMPMIENEEKPLCTQEECSKDNAKSCRCFCSVKCGPREITPTDTPKYDEFDQKCFCAPRDKFLYHRNGCSIRQQRKLQGK
jgi:hypothetical protein